MEVVLKSRSHLEMGEIRIRHSPFSVGRHEPSFSNYGNEAVAQLSRRHARFFEEDGIVYIADLGSTNGTTLNGGSVQGRPERVRSGDEICFAEQLVYVVDIEKEAADGTVLVPATSSIRLALQPLKDDAEVEPIVVTQFPFLIGKTDDVFSRYQKHCAREVNYLSRRHALIFRKDDQLYIEDLGSTNGTFVSGDRLDEHARVLQDDDTVAIGGDFFAYTVKLEREPEKEPETVVHTHSNVSEESAGESADEAKTTFISTATSFLDIFYLQDDAEQVEKAGGDDEQTRQSLDDGRETDTRSRSKSKSTGFFAKAHTFFGELRTVLVGSERGGRSRWVWWVAGIVGLLLIGFALTFIGSEEQQLKELLAEKKFLEGIVFANDYLRDHPSDDRVIELATEALAKSVVPKWLGRLNAAQYTEAKSLLEMANGLTQYNKSGLEMLELLGWIVDLEGFMNARGGVQAPIVLFEHEDEMGALIAWWEIDPRGHRRLLARLQRYQPEFKEAYARALSNLRTLRSEQALYLKAIKNLKDKIETELSAQRATALPAILSDFAQRYPKIAGINKLQTDLKNYLEFERAVQAGDLDKILSLQTKLAFLTKPFRDHAGKLAATALPPEDLLAQYRKAIQAWLSGSPQLAIETLEGLRGGDWNEIINSKLNRYLKIEKSYQALQQVRGAEDYGQRLVAFYSTLDQTQDEYYHQAIEDEFLGYKETIQQRAQEVIRDSEQQWAAYLKNGRIDGLDRVDGSISQTYRKRAARLSKAYESLILGSELYDLLRVDLSRPWKRLSGEILNEVKRQRQWLIDLNLVLEASLLNAKLDLLPNPEESAHE